MPFSDYSGTAQHEDGSSNGVDPAPVGLQETAGEGFRAHAIVVAMRLSSRSVRHAHRKTDCICSLVSIWKTCCLVKEQSAMASSADRGGRELHGSPQMT